MTKTEADKIAHQIFADAVRKTETAYKELEARGWKQIGLDGPTPPEIKAIDDECRRKIKELAAQIDE
jgi:hypothetical protein